MKLSIFISVAAIVATVGFDSAAAADDFATLKGIAATPMASGELSQVKGLHFHFATAGGEHFVNIQQGKDGFVPTPNADPAPDDFPLGVGKGYRGLCGAALKAVGMFIPGQDTTTGIGGGC